MNKSLLLLTTTIAFTPVVYAQDLSWGDPKAEAGQVKVSGAIRTRYLSKDFQDEANEGSNNNWRLADIKLNLNYENPKWLAALDARCYEYDELCDAVFLSDAWVGYKISDQQRVSVGLQPVEFGFGRFWGSSYYETLMNTVGFEDISALGLRYQISQNDYSLSLGFYPTDGGNYKGTSKDSSRYSPAFVEADDLTTGTYLKERNIWIGRLSKKFEVTPIDGLSTEIGTSFWHSELKNKKNGQDGSRNSWNVFTQTQYNAWQWMLLAGSQSIQNRDTEFPDFSTLGAFDFPYQVANKTDYVVNEINYSVAKPFYEVKNIKPYFSYSRLFKDQAGYEDSERIIAGVAFNYKKIGIQGEYIWSKNDPMVGASSNGLAQGDGNGWDRMLYLALGYYF
ncbi:porin [uncultured Acinetobacter sp.]|uniref:porin n=1 Tax=uncultured Acinetobacter sp. TaxID=165433 RepID=UPI0025904180|nr:porin [uncultured Acinetobacter sp.]